LSLRRIIQRNGTEGKVSSIAKPAIGFVVANISRESRANRYIERLLCTFSKSNANRALAARSIEALLSVNPILRALRVLLAAGNYQKRNYRDRVGRPAGERDSRGIRELSIARDENGWVVNRKWALNGHMAE